VPHAKKAGVSDAKISAVREAVIGETFAENERIVLELADAMTRNIEVPEALMDRLKARLDARGVVETVATVAAYNMVSRFLVALQIGH
jgi:alkylhydroperoxidase family enzyme